jgi:hypothetical protein
MDWLSAIKFNSKHDSSRNLRNAKTGGWLFKNTQFESWADTGGSMLWLNGRCMFPTFRQP